MFFPGVATINSEELRYETSLPEEGGKLKRFSSVDSYVEEKTLGIVKEASELMTLE